MLALLWSAVRLWFSPAPSFPLLLANRITVFAATLLIAPVAGGAASLWALQGLGLGVVLWHSGERNGTWARGAALLLLVGLPLTPAFAGRLAAASAPQILPWLLAVDALALAAFLPPWAGLRRWEGWGDRAFPALLALGGVGGMAALALGPRPTDAGAWLYGVLSAVGGLAGAAALAWARGALAARWPGRPRRSVRSGVGAGLSAAAAGALSLWEGPAGLLWGLLLLVVLASLGR